MRQSQKYMPTEMIIPIKTFNKSLHKELMISFETIKNLCQKTITETFKISLPNEMMIPIKTLKKSLYKEMIIPIDPFTIFRCG